MVMPLPNTLVDLLNDIGVNHYRLIGILSSLKEKGLIDSRHERVFALRYGIFNTPHTHREIAEMIGTKKALARKITNQELDKILISAITKIKKEHRNELVAWHKAGYFNRPMFAMYKHRTWADVPYIWISPRCRNAFEQLGINRPIDLTSITKEDCSIIRNFGRITIAEAKDVGLLFGITIPHL